MILPFQKSSRHTHPIEGYQFIVRFMSLVCFEWREITMVYMLHRRYIEHSPLYKYDIPVGFPPGIIFPERGLSLEG